MERMSPPSTTLSIDIGLHGLGIGYFAGEELVAAWYSPSTRDQGERGPLAWRKACAGLVALDLHPDVLVMETMQVYVGGTDKADDLLQLQGIAGVLVGMYTDALPVSYLPAAWKGQVPTDILANRVGAYLVRMGWDHLVEGNTPRKRWGDVMHGVGVGLVHLGLTRKGVCSLR